MSGKWTEIKNAGWVLCIGICLLAVAVGLIIASVNRYSGDSFSGSAELSAESVKDSENVTELTQGTGGGTLLTYTEQGVWFAPADAVEGRREGWETLLAALERTLDATARRAAE